ncbi:FKBP-type peptidyl-prolyl cis-trans isomerase [Nonomuraea sp. NPDC049400]|uniref:FKBP-type peptidyl-prolyl cis-trans isomerase n=1 Tax=Nonomuraea sp. NPDC049400 TaxID=3364352 RepID=UPI00378BCBFC
MRRHRTAALLPALVLLAGCAGGPDMAAGGPGLTAGGSGMAAGLDVTVGGLDMRVAGPFGARPTITFPGGKPAAGLQVVEPATGAGPPLAADDVAIVQYTAHVWDGKDNRVVDSTFDRGVPAAFPVSEGLGGALRGHRVGSRVVAAVPSEPRGPGEELLYVVDILGAHSRGASAGPGGGTLAGVRVTGDSRPALKVPATAPPAAFAVKVLARGEGRATQAGQLVVAQYEGASWSRRRVFDTTWTTGRPKAFRIGDGGVIKGWDRALVGVPAGSRVLMIVPPSYGYGAAGDPAHGVMGSDTLVFVVDVLAAY